MKISQYIQALMLLAMLLGFAAGISGADWGWSAGFILLIILAFWGKIEGETRARAKAQEGSALSREAPDKPEKGSAANTQDAAARYAKGLEFNELGKWDDAVKCFDQAIRLDPRNSSFWVAKGVALAELGRHDEAVKCYDKAIEIKSQV